MKGILIIEETNPKDTVTCVTLSDIDCNFCRAIVAEGDTPIMLAKIRAIIEEEILKESGSAIKSLANTRDLLINKNNELIEENKHLKEKLVKRKKLLNALSGQATSAYEKKMKENAELKQQVEKLEEENKRDKYTIEQICQDYTRQLVDDAYKEVYCSMTPIWQGVNFRQLTKREQMWENIIRLHKVEDIVIEVKKEDVTTFLHELEDRIPEITWSSGVKLFGSPDSWLRPINGVYETLKTHDGICFRLDVNSQLTYSCNPNLPYYANLRKIAYLPPMRWDLFKKGRIIVGVRREQYEEFKAEANRQFGVINHHNPYDNFNYSFFMYDKKVNYITPISKSQFCQIETINGVKVVYWEDVK